MSKRNHIKNTCKLKNALAHGSAEGFGPMCNSRHPKRVTFIPTGDKKTAQGADNTQGGRQTPESH